jgi:transcription initiation factor IIE alpha subunit
MYSNSQLKHLKSKIMKQILFLTVAFLLTSSLFAQTKAGKIDTTKHTTYYSCSMHPNIVMNKPGKCPKCGMDLILSKKEQLKADVTKGYRCPVHVDVSSHDQGKCPQCGKKLQLSGKEQMKAEVGKVYTCPMHPNVALDKEGKCPKCGAALVEKRKSK